MIFLPLLRSFQDYFYPGFTLEGVLYPLGVDHELRFTDVFRPGPGRSLESDVTMTLVNR